MLPLLQCDWQNVCVVWSSSQYGIGYLNVIEIVQPEVCLYVCTRVCVGCFFFGSEKHARSAVNAVIHS